MIFGSHVSRWLSKWITDAVPHLTFIDLNAARVVVWLSPKVMMRGVWDTFGEFAVRPEMAIYDCSRPWSATMLSS
jgi:hypothetical protein